jgi:hypothetical protein
VTAAVHGCGQRRGVTPGVKVVTHAALSLGASVRHSKPVTVGEAVQLAVPRRPADDMISEPAGPRDFGLAKAEMAAKRRIIAELTTKE